MISGKIKWFNKTKGYGFLFPVKGGREIFFHLSNIKGHMPEDTLNGKSVKYLMGNGPKGSQAIHVEILPNS